MDQHDSASRVTHTVREQDIDSRWGYRNLGGAWWLALLAIPLLLAALATFISGGGIEDDLRADAQKALANGQFEGIDVAFNGRDATVSVAPGANVTADQLDAAHDVVEDVAGVRVVLTDGDGLASAGGSEEPSTEPEPEPEPEVDPTCEPATVQAAIDEALGENKILFDYAVADITAEAQGQIDVVAAAVAGCSELTLNVIGNANPNAPTSLSEERAANVAAALTEAGVEASVTSTSAYAEEPQGEFRLNRYVDIQAQ